MVAILEAAIKDARDAGARAGAMAWVTSTDRCWPFSFENICVALDMDPHAVRGVLERDVFLPVGPAAPADVEV